MRIIAVIPAQAGIQSKTTSPVADRQLVTFFCFAKMKVTKEKATPIHHLFEVPCVARLVRLPHKLARSATRPRAQTCSSEFPDQPPLLGGGTGDKKQKFKFKNLNPNLMPREGGISPQPLTAIHDRQLWGNQSTVLSVNSVLRRHSELS